MLEKEIKLKLLWKNSIGSNISLFFGIKRGDVVSVLTLSNVVAFREHEFTNINSYFLQVRDGGSSYGLDMSLRLKNPNYQNFNEIFLFVDKQGGDIAFRALVEEISWKDYSELTNEELNYL